MIKLGSKFNLKEGKKVNEQKGETHGKEIDGITSYFRKKKIAIIVKRNTSPVSKHIDN